MSCIEVDLATNADQTKLVWRDTGFKSKPILLRGNLLKKLGVEIRQILSELDKYVQYNPELNDVKDPTYARYSEILQRLRIAGRALRLALFDRAVPGTDTFEKVTQSLGLSDELRVYCSDSDVTLPLGFVYTADLDRPSRVTKPSISDFNDFWLSQFCITMRVEGGGCATDPVSIKAIYALNELELSKAASLLAQNHRSSEQLKRLQLLYSLEVGVRYDWYSARAAWNDVRNEPNIVFVFGHSDGDRIALDQTPALDSGNLRDLFYKDPTEVGTLLILNCCLSATGSDGGSLLSIVAQRGFCGLIGTEAEIANIVSLQCGARIMWELCANGLALGDAFQAMQREPDLFPLNLLYTCYADRRFRLRLPIPTLGS